MTNDVFEVNFVSDRNDTDIGFYATYEIHELDKATNTPAQTPPAEGKHRKQQKTPQNATLASNRHHINESDGCRNSGL